MTERGVQRGWLVVPPLVGMAMVTLATEKGLYVSPDSVSYIGTARALLDGGGWTPPPGLPPVGHFPPLFTLGLAAVGRAGVDPLDAARIVNVVACGAIIALVGLVLRRQTGSTVAAFVGSLLALVAVDLLTFSAAALSEPLFMLSGLGAMVVLAAYLDQRRRGLLVVAAGLAAAAVLTRYVGVALVVAGMAALVRFGAGRRRRAAAEAALFAVVAMTPVLVWMAWAGRSGDAGSDRTIAVHLPDLDYLGQAVRPLARWVVPFVPPALGLALAALVVVGGVVFVRRRTVAPAPAAASALEALPWVLCAFAVVYLAVLVVDRAVLDASGRLDSRFLAPLHLVAIVLVVPPLYRALRQPGGRAAGAHAERTAAVTAATAAAAVLVGLQVADGAVWTAGGVTDTGISRRGYSAEAWRRSEVVAAVAAADPGDAVHTNGFDAVFLLTGRVTLALPAEKAYLTGRDNPRYAEELAAVARRGGLVAYFGALTARQSFLATQAELEQSLPLERVISDDVGTLYRLGPGPAATAPLPGDATPGPEP